MSPMKTRRNSPVIDTRTDSVVATYSGRAPARGACESHPTVRPYMWRSAGHPSVRRSMPDEECEKLKADKSKDGIAVVDVASRR